ncbi:MAG TPA: sugar-binding protein [bacterium]|nr:sugar-binding protein [bacterium]
MRYQAVFGFMVCLMCWTGLTGGNGWADRSTLDPMKTAVALPLPSAPVIDGTIDLANESWNYAAGAIGGSGNAWRIQVNENLEDFVQWGRVSSGDAPWDNEDLSYNVWVGYDADYLYVAVRVMDIDIFTDDAAAGSANGNTWLDDSVEVFVDGDNSNFASHDTTGTNPEVVGTGGQFVITANNAYREAEAGNPGYGENQAWYAKTALTDTGYDAEFRISMAALGHPQPGDILGFSVAVNDDDFGVTRQVIWCGEPHVEATYGNLILGPRTYTAPKTGAAPVVDGIISAGEYANAPAIAIDRHSGFYEGEVGDDADSWLDGDHRYEAWIVHDDHAIYVAVDVTDDIISTDSAEAGSEDGTTWEDDSVEIFFDANNDKSLIQTNNDLSVHPPFEGQYVVTANGAVRDAEASNPVFGEAGDWYGAASTTAKGYQIEARLNKSLFQNPADGTSIGFNLGLNDDDGAGRKVQLLWQGRAHYEASYGILTLSSQGGGTPVLEWSLY